MTYIEEYLEYIVNTHLNSLNSSDHIYFSIYKQVTRGVGLTDRQYNLVLKKVKEHCPDVEKLPVNIPLREIDRSKYIKVVDTAEVYSDIPLDPYKQKWQWIKIRFPFSKKDIVAIESLKSKCKEYHHFKGSHVHFFRFTYNNAYEVYELLHNRNFEIDSQIIYMHKKVAEIKNNEKDVLPFLENNILYNVDQSVVKNLQDTDIIYKQDKSIKYGYKIISPYTDNTLASEISVRNEPEILASPKTYNLNKIAESFLQLDRFPVIALINENDAYNEILQIYSAFSGFIENKQQSVLFRIEKSDHVNADLNNFIREKQLNNWVDKDTKIVYIKKKVLPKVLLKSNFIPTTALAIKSDRSSTTVDQYVKFNCDLIVYNDDAFSTMKRWTYGNLQTNY